MEESLPVTLLNAKRYSNYRYCWVKMEWLVSYSKSSLKLSGLGAPGPNGVQTATNGERAIMPALSIVHPSQQSL